MNIPPEPQQGPPNVHSEVDALRREAAELRAQLAALGDFPPGHYHSPIPLVDELKAREAMIWPAQLPASLGGIDLNESHQRALMRKFSQYYHELPFRDEPVAGLRYSFDNVWFCYADAIALYCMIRHLRPERIVEVGSGYSSAVMLDTNDLHFDGRIACTFIEPNTDRLLSLLRGEDAQRHSVIDRPLQDVDLDVVEALAENDILFIDSSHVSKVGSDVNRIFFDMLPALRAGVVVHLHDIVYPFEYPKEWVFEGRSWNEAYLLRAFLQYNTAFIIEWFGSFMIHSHRNRFAEQLPLCLRNPGGSIWLRKVRS